MTRKEIAEYRRKLRDIVKKGDGKQRLKELKELAKEVGAGYVHTEIAPTTTTVPDGNGTLTTTCQNPISISESELVLNINNALQTETMIDMCRIATENCDIAQRATKAAICHYRIAAGIAILAMIAAWVAVFIYN